MREEHSNAGIKSFGSWRHKTRQMRIVNNGAIVTSNCNKNKK